MKGYVVVLLLVVLAIQGTKTSPNRQEEVHKEVKSPQSSDDGVQESDFSHDEERQEAIENAYSEEEDHVNAENTDADNTDENADAENAEEEDEDKNNAEVQAAYLKNGDTIALQSHNRYYWLGCSSSYCQRSSCPKMDITTKDWYNCRGDVFRIYQRNRGYLRSGYQVGIYNINSRTWFGCSSYYCIRNSCPGRPNSRYGFSYSSKWKSCWGQVFKLYAKGKRNGAYIRHGDDVALYNQRTKKYASLSTSYVYRTTCLGSRNPPRFTSWDNCPLQTFRIFKGPNIKC